MLSPPSSVSYSMPGPSQWPQPNKRGRRSPRGFLRLAGVVAAAALAIISGILMVRFLPAELMLREEAILTMDVVRSVVLPSKPMRGAGDAPAKPSERTRSVY